MKRHEVTDEQWEVIRPILPKRAAKTGRPPSDPRLMLNGILWILRTGSPWRGLPERFSPCQIPRRENEKLAINFLAMMKRAMIQRCLKFAFSDRA